MTIWKDKPHDPRLDGAPGACFCADCRVKVRELRCRFVFKDGQRLDPRLLPEWARAHLEEYEREKVRQQFIDMGYDDCETCQRARLRDAWVGEPVRR
jgi:hypothetical protein